MIEFIKKKVELSSFEFKRGQFYLSKLKMRTVFSYYLPLIGVSSKSSKLGFRKKIGTVFRWENQSSPKTLSITHIPNENTNYYYAQRSGFLLPIPGTVLDTIMLGRKMDIHLDLNCFSTMQHDVSKYDRFSS